MQLHAEQALPCFYSDFCCFYYRRIKKDEDQGKYVTFKTIMHKEAGEDHIFVLLMIMKPHDYEENENMSGVPTLFSFVKFLQIIRRRYVRNKGRPASRVNK